MLLMPPPLDTINESSEDEPDQNFASKLDAADSSVSLECVERVYEEDSTSNEKDNEKDKKDPTIVNELEFKIVEETRQQMQSIFERFRERQRLDYVRALVNLPTCDCAHRRRLMDARSKLKTLPQPELTSDVTLANKTFLRMLCRPCMVVLASFVIVALITLYFLFNGVMPRTFMQASRSEAVTPKRTQYYTVHNFDIIY